MTSRPRIPPSLGRPRLPISMDDNFRGSRALPSPTSPISPIPILETEPSHPHQQEPEYRSRHRTQSDSKDHHDLRDPPHTRHRPNFYHRHSVLPSPSVGPWEEHHRGRHREIASAKTRDDTMAPCTPWPDTQGWAQSVTTPSLWSYHDSSSFSHFPTPGIANDEAVHLPARSLSVTDLPRNPNGSKKQQSGRRRTACDRCKRQKSSVSRSFFLVQVTRAEWG